MCVVVKGRITVEGDDDDKARNTKIVFKNNAHLNHAYKKLITHL